MAKKSRTRQDRWNEEASALKTAFEAMKAIVEEYRSKAEDTVNAATEKLTEELQALYDECQEKCGESLGKVQDGFAALRDIRTEFDDWGEQRNEATKDKLDTVQGFDLDVSVEINTNTDITVEAEINVDPDLDGLESSIEELESAELPMGFGRD